MIKKFLNLYIVIYMLLIIISIFLAVTTDKIGFEVDNEDVLHIHKKDIIDGQYDIGYRRLTQDDSKRSSFLFEVNKSDLKRYDSESLTLIISQFCANGYKVYFNDILIGQQGDYENGRANLWNATSIFTFDTRFVKETNLIRIESYSLYDIGMVGDFIYITTPDIAFSLSEKISLIGEKTNLVSIGILLLTAMIICTIFFISSEKSPHYIFMAIGIIALMIYCVDFHKIQYIPFDYLVYKKIIIMGLYGCCGFLTISIGMNFKTKIATYVGILFLLGAIVGSLVSEDMIAYKSFYVLYNFAGLLPIGTWVYSTIKNHRKKPEAKILTIGFVFTLLYVGFYGVMTKFNLGSMNAPIFYSITAATVPLTVIFVDFETKEKIIIAEREKSKKEAAKAMTDGLTGIYNQRYLNEHIDNLDYPYSVIILDVDGFKRINDNFGHIAGDQTLIYIAGFLKKTFRKTDIICRYGGDEFVVILVDCSVGRAKKSIDVLLRKINETPIVYDEEEFTISLSAGIFFVEKEEPLDTILKKADVAMYMAKKAGKNNSFVFNQINEIDM